MRRNAYNVTALFQKPGPPRTRRASFLAGRTCGTLALYGLHGCAYLGRVLYVADSAIKVEEAAAPPPAPQGRSE